MKKVLVAIMLASLVALAAAPALAANALTPVLAAASFNNDVGVGLLPSLTNRSMSAISIGNKKGKQYKLVSQQSAQNKTLKPFDELGFNLLLH